MYGGWTEVLSLIDAWSPIVFCNARFLGDMQECTGFNARCCLECVMLVLSMCWFVADAVQQLASWGPPTSVFKGQPLHSTFFFFYHTIAVSRSALQLSPIQLTEYLCNRYQMEVHLALVDNYDCTGWVLILLVPRLECIVLLSFSVAYLVILSCLFFLPSAVVIVLSLLCFLPLKWSSLVSWYYLIVCFCAKAFALLIESCFKLEVWEFYSSCLMLLPKNMLSIFFFKWFKWQKLCDWICWQHPTVACLKVKCLSIHPGARVHSQARFYYQFRVMIMSVRVGHVNEIFANQEHHHLSCVLIEINIQHWCAKIILSCRSEQTFLSFHFRLRRRSLRAVVIPLMSCIQVKAMKPAKKFICKSKNATVYFVEAFVFGSCALQAGNPLPCRNLCWPLWNAWLNVIL